MSRNDNISLPPSMFDGAGVHNSKTTKNLTEVRNESSSYAHMLTLGKVFKRYGGNSLSKAISGGERYVWCPNSLDAVCWAKNKGDAKYVRMSARDLCYVGPIKRNTSSTADDTQGSNASAGGASSSGGAGGSSSSSSTNNICGFALEFAQGSLELQTDSVEDRDHWIRVFTWLRENNSSVSRPYDFQHTMSVNSDFTWTLSPGESIESVFKLEKTLGAGTFGVVRKATHIPTGFTLACKIVHVQNGNFDTSDVKREIEVLRQCRHRNIIDYYGCYGPDTSNNLWILMNYCQFGSIVDLLSHVNKGLTETQISYILASTVLGLHYLHTVKHIIHRDIKGRNILVSNTGCIKLTDFGISKCHINMGDWNEGMGTIGTGSPHWMAPEVVQDLPATEKSDIWSLGITAIELITGLPPRAHESIYEVMSSTVSLPSPTLPTNGNSWSYEYHDFVNLCLKKSPQDRPSTKDLLLHPFIKKGLTEFRCLDPILNAMDVPKNPHDNVSINVNSSAAVVQQQNQNNLVTPTSGLGQHSISTSTTPVTGVATSSSAAGAALGIKRSTTPNHVIYTSPSDAAIHGNNNSNNNSRRESSSEHGIHTSTTTSPILSASTTPSANSPNRPIINAHTSSPAMSSASAAPTPSNAQNPMVIHDRDDFDLAESVASFSSHFSFDIYDTQKQTLQPHVLTSLYEFSQPSYIDIVVGTPHTITQGMSKYSSYPVRVRRNVHSGSRIHPVTQPVTDPGSLKMMKLLASQEPLVIWKRYSDFVWLNDTLKSIYPYIVIPPLPAKTLSNRFDEKTLTIRRQGIHWNLEYLVRHPVLCKSFILHSFLMLDEQKFSEFKKQLKQKQVDIKKKAKSCTSIPNDVCYDDLAIWKISQTTPNLPLFSRLKPGSVEYEAILNSPPQYMLSCIDQYSQYVVSYMEQLHSAFSTYQSGLKVIDQLLQKLNIFLTTIFDRSDQGKRLLAIQSKQIMSQKLQSLGYDISLSKFDITSYATEKIAVYAKQYQPYFDVHTVPTANVTSIIVPNRLSLQSTLTHFLDIHTLLPSGYTLVGKNLIRYFSVYISKNISNTFVTCLYPCEYYTTMYKTMQETISQRDIHVLRVQVDLQKSGFAAYPVTQYTKDNYNSKIGYDTEERNIDEVINTKLKQVTSTYSTSLIVSSSPLASTLPENANIKFIEPPSTSTLEMVNKVPETVQRRALDTFADEVYTEFTLIQRQKEAHVIKMAKDFCTSMAQIAAKEAIMWNTIVNDLTMLPGDIEFFDLPL